MAITVTMPQLGETVTEGTILSWAKAPGDTIAEDEVLLEISTDKVDTEVPSPAGGVIKEILVAEGETVTVGTPLAVIGEPGEMGDEATAPETEEPQAAEAPPAPAPEAAEEPAEDQAPAEPQPVAPAAEEGQQQEEQVQAPAAIMATPVPTDHAPRRGVLSPVVRKLAAEHGIDLNHVVGTGDGGRITRSDVMAYIDSGGAKVATEPEPVAEEAAAPSVTEEPAVAEVPEAGEEPEAGEDLEAAPELEAAEEPVAAEASEAAEPEAEEPAAEEPAEAPAAQEPAPAAMAPPAAAVAAAPAAAPAPIAAPPAPVAQPQEPAVARPAASAQPAPAPSQPAPAPTAAQPAAAAPSTDGDEVRDIGRLRKRIADNMVMAKATAAHVWTSVEVDYDNVERIRLAHKAAFKAQHGYSLTYLPFIARATIEALHAFPVVNSALHLDEGQHVFHGRVNLGIAVDMNQGGLVVVTIKDADSRSMKGLAKEIREKAVKARDGNLEPDDVSGSTFTITNPGPYGSFMSAPIINVPNAAILSTDTVMKRPTVLTLPDGSDTIAIRPIGYLGLTWDHRVFDGSTAVLFLQRIKHNLESWDWEQELL